MSSSRAQRAVLLTALTAAGALALSACGGGDTGKSGGGGGTGFVTNTGGISTVAEGHRKATKKVAGETLEGDQLDLADFKGKVVVVNVWGSWCAPCRAEAKHFAKVATELEPKGVQFVGLNTRDPSKSPAIAFEREYKIPYPSLYDPIGKLLVNGFPRGTLMPQAIPSTIVLDREGKIAARALKALSEEDLRKLIDPVLAEK